MYLYSRDENSSWPPNINADETQPALNPLVRLTGLNPSGPTHLHFASVNIIYFTHTVIKQKPLTAAKLLKLMEGTSLSHLKRNITTGF